MRVEEAAWGIAGSLSPPVIATEKVLDELGPQSRRSLETFAPTYMGVAHRSMEATQLASDIAIEEIVVEVRGFGTLFWSSERS